MDLFWVNPFKSFLSLWNFTLKIIYILTSFFIVFLMTRVYPRSRESERGWRLSGYALGSSLVTAPWLGSLLAAMFHDRHNWHVVTTFHDFSELLESTCILPQLLLLRQTTIPTVIDSFYLASLFLYRIFYVLNWIWREADGSDAWKPQRLDVLAGCIQVILYCDFAWVYYTRQRVKLRGNGVVDSDDFGNGLFIRRLFGKPAADEEGVDEESAPALGNGRPGFSGDGHVLRPAPERTGSTAANKWGLRGISVSADESVLAHERARGRAGYDENHAEGEERDPFMDDDAEEDARMKDPDELAAGLEDEESDDEGILPGRSSIAKTAGITGGEEWRG